MTGRAPPISAEWIDALAGTLDVFRSLVLEPRVVEAWSNASELHGYTVGGIAGHVLSLMVGLEQRVEAGPADIDVIPYRDWYGSALRSTEVHPGLIDVGEHLAAAGPETVAADLAAIGVQIGRCLRRTRRDFVIPLASVVGAGVRLDDFLRTRFVEITVHADDVGASTGVPRPDFAPPAWTLAAGVLTEIAGVRGDDADFVLAFSRPGRHPSDDRVAGA